ARDCTDDGYLLIADGPAGELRACSVARGLTPLVLVAVTILAAKMRLVHLHHAREREGVALHGGTPAVAHVPASVVVGARLLAKDDPVDLQRRDALLGGEHEVADLEPELQPDL